MAGDNKEEIGARQAPSCPGGFLHQIRSGDTLYALASRFGTTVDAILRANPGTDPASLRVGQLLCIPTAAVPGHPPGVPVVHRVQRAPAVSFTRLGPATPFTR